MAGGSVGLYESDPDPILDPSASKSGKGRVRAIQLLPSASLTSGAPLALEFLKGLGNRYRCRCRYKYGYRFRYGCFYKFGGAFKRGLGLPSRDLGLM